MKESSEAINSGRDRDCHPRLVLPGFYEWRSRVEDRIKIDSDMAELRRLRDNGEIEEWQFRYRADLRICEIITEVQ